MVESLLLWTGVLAALSVAFYLTTKGQRGVRWWEVVAFGLTIVALGVVNEGLAPDPDRLRELAPIIVTFIIGTVAAISGLIVVLLLGRRS